MTHGWLSSVKHTKINFEEWRQTSSSSGSQWLSKNGQKNTIEVNGNRIGLVPNIYSKKQNNYLFWVDYPFNASHSNYKWHLFKKKKKKSQANRKGFASFSVVK